MPRRWNRGCTSVRTLLTSSLTSLNRGQLSLSRIIRLCESSSFSRTYSQRTDRSSMAQSDAAFLKNKVGLLAYFSEEQLHDLANASQIVAASPGDVIVHAGDELHFLGVVLEGKVAASVPADDGQQHSLGELLAGDTFVEMAVMTGDPAVADFVAMERSRVMLVPLTLFQA